MSSLLSSVLRGSFFFALALEAAFVHGEGLFPVAPPLLGGASGWERRLSPEFRLGEEDSRAAFGLSLRFHWGPQWGMDLDAHCILGSGIGSRDGLSAFIPVRIHWTDRDFVAPVIGVEYFQWSPTEHKTNVPIGVQFRVEVLGLGVWMQAAFSPSLKSETLAAFVQVDRSFVMARNSFGFFGVRYDERLWESRRASGVYFVSGSRF